MSTIQNPPTDFAYGGPAGGGALAEGRLSDLALSVHNPAWDLVLPVIKIHDWEAVEASVDPKPREIVEALVGAQSALLARVTSRMQESSDYKELGLAMQQQPDVEAVTLLRRLFTADTRKEMLKQAFAKAAELQRELEKLRALEDRRRHVLAETIPDSATVALKLREHFRSGQIKDSVDLRTAWWTVADQGAAAGCVGYALSGLLHRQRKERLEIPSARFLWQAAKEIDAEVKPTTMIAGAGTSLRAALSLVQRYGYALEAELPSESPQLYSGGIKTFYDTIERRQVRGYVNLGNDIKNRLAWLSLGRPILCSLRVGPDFIGASGPGCVRLTETDPENQIAHAAVIAGYRIKGGRGLESGMIADLVKARDAAEEKDQVSPQVKRDYDQLPVEYLIRNSAGPSWGDRGYAWFAHVDLFKLLMEEYGVLCGQTDDLGLPQSEPSAR